MRQTNAELTTEVRELRERIAALSASSTASGPDSNALRRVEARLLFALENARALIVDIDPAGRMTYVSPSVTALLGHAPDELLHHSAIEWAHEEDRGHLEEFYRKLFTAGEGLKTEYRARHNDGRWIWVESTGTTYQTPDGRIHGVAFVHDVDDAKRTADALRRSEERYRILADSTEDLVAELDEEGRTLYVSPSFERILGYAAEDLIGTTPFAMIHPDDVERLAEAFQTRLHVTRAPGHGEMYRVRHRDGSWRWLQGGGINYRAADGELRILSVSRDITEKRQREEERGRFEERAQQAQKLEGLGVMAGGIAHDFNNLLTPILGDASLALADLPPDSPVRIRLEKIQQTAQRAAGLTGQMLAYAGTESLQVEVIGLSGLVQEMSRLIDSAVERQAILDYQLLADIPVIEGDAAQISQILINLVTNAGEALGEEGGRVSIRTGSLDAGREILDRLALGGDLPEGLFAYLEVEDDGGGLTEEDQARIFDPFFSTKFKGRGLGLAAVLGIVRGHGGGIEIESEPGGGTRIRVLFPALKGVAGADPLETHQRGWKRGTVLVADDDEGVREFAAEALERGGWAVLRAADGAEALRIFRERAAELSAVLLDRSMPSGTNEETFDAIRRIRKDAPIILVSGYSPDGVARRFTAAGRAAFLQKPFLPATLLEKVRRLVDARGPESEPPVE